MYTLSDELKEKILGCLDLSERAVLFLIIRYILKLSRSCKANNASPEITDVLDNCADLLNQIHECDYGKEVPYNSFNSSVVTMTNKAKVFIDGEENVNIDLPEKLIEEIWSSLSLKDLGYLGDSGSYLLRVSIICNFYGSNPEVTETFRNAASLVSQFYYR